MIPSALLPHRVTVEAYAGNGANGPLYGGPTTVRGRLVARRRMLRDPHGVQVVADAEFIVRPNVTVPVESRVTTADGRVFEVLDSSDNGDLDRTSFRTLTLAGPR